MAVTQTGQRVIKMTAQSDALDRKMILHGFRLVAKAAAADDDFVVTDTAGNELFVSVANGSDFIDSISFDCHPVEGIIFSVNDNSNAGDLYIYIE